METIGIKEIAVALSKFQGELEVVLKEHLAKGEKFDYTYATQATILKSTRKPMEKHGLSVVQMPTLQGEGDRERFVLKSVLLHTSGQSFECVYPIEPINPKDPRSVGSAITYAKRYSFCALLGIATEDDDGKAATKGKQEVEQPKTKPGTEEGKEVTAETFIKDIRKLDTLEVAGTPVDVYGILGKNEICYQTTNMAFVEDARIAKAENSKVRIKSKLTKNGLGILALDVLVSKAKA